MAGSEARRRRMRGEATLLCMPAGSSSLPAPAPARRPRPPPSLSGLDLAGVPSSRSGGHGAEGTLSSGHPLRRAGTATSSTRSPRAERQRLLLPRHGRAGRGGEAGSVCARSGGGGEERRSCSCVARQLRAARVEPRWGRRGDGVRPLLRLIWRERDCQLGLEEA